MNLAQRLTIIIFFTCCICLPNLSSWAEADTNAKPVPVQDTFATASPFDATGLTVRPGETAEEILLRAHNYDPGAVLMTAIGYERGIGGFPKDHGLAIGWFIAADNMGLQGVSALSNLTIRDETGWPAPENICANARHSPFAPLLKQADLLDIEYLCTKTIPVSTDVEKFYAAKPARQKKTIDLLRVGSGRRLSREEYQKLSDDLDVHKPKPPLFFYAATTHDWESETPDWRPERMISFFSYNKEVNDKERRAGTLFLLQHFNTDPEVALELFHKAHMGDPGAIRAMAMNYYTGEQGFPCVQLLSERWINIGGYQGDPQAMEVAASLGIERGLSGEEWLFAAGEFGSERAKALSTTVMQTTSIILGCTVDELQKRGMTLAERIRKHIAEPGQQQYVPVPQQDTEKPQ